MWIVPKAKTDTGKLRDDRRKKQAAHTLRTMIAAYNEADFKMLCFDFGIDYESIAGDEKREKMLEFVKQFYRHNQVSALTNFLQGDRPEWNWRAEEKGDT